MIHNIIKANSYFDSVTLMLFSSKLNGVAGVKQAAVMMGTDHNKSLMLASGILEEKHLDSITANDLVIGIDAETQVAVDEAVSVLNAQFENKKTTSDTGKSKRVKNLDAAIKEVPDINISVISLPGRYAKAEAMKCLKKGIHVMLFSDNVSIQDEIELKDYAIENGLLMMGPDCGTAIINGVALGFANVIRRGNIGLTAASGTGLQEVSVIIDKLGGGISQALGTGGRDLKKDIGGRMMLLTLDALAQDDMTEVIGIVSKPPAQEVMKKIVEKAKTINKPIVACFLGGDLDVFKGTNIIGTSTLEEAAYALVKVANNDTVDSVTNSPLYLNSDALANTVPASNAPYIRALYTGGTLAYESLLMLSKELSDVYSNIAVDKKYIIENPEVSTKHTVLDMGEDYFTDGKPHPMIDPDARANRIIKEGLETDTGVILLDCVLGYGSNEDPSASIIKAVNKVKETRSDIVFVASVTGTKNDPQSLERNEQNLKDAGIYVLPTNAQAAQFAIKVLKKRGVING
ncbi:acyl-CoA synthetase FdrA [Liberiplasma polymorphum]|uniref:acyl-CoA synthetase FdrA n=1 Tax=Liberiplasma polymorphum TaxID=3374570 RepID=UPI0037731849